MKSTSIKITPQPIIFHVLHRLDFAGAEILAANLARALRDRYRFVFLCLDGVGALGAQLRDEGFTVESLTRRPGIDVSTIRTVRQAFARHQPALIHAHQYTPFSYAAMARGFSSNPPILFTEHGRHYPDRRRFKRLIANRFFLKRHDRISAVAKCVKQALVDYEALPTGRIDVIYNGIDPQHFQNPRADARERLRASLGIDPSCPLIVHIARFHPVKDHATSLRAFAQVHAAMSDAHFILVGDGPDRSVMETLATELGCAGASHDAREPASLLPDQLDESRIPPAPPGGRGLCNVHFLGIRHDIPDLLAAADVLVLSSVSEGLCLTLLEAMAAKVPIAATAVGGNVELIEHRRTGLLSPRQDTDALAANVVALLTDDALSRQLAGAAYQRVIEQFTQQQMHEAYAKVYEEMVRQ